ncbi:hypothetical protein SteCoe_22406 [Stentor coeruleus]|uniref:NACHT domain-containing protein n=1 Tax=Stentor coeruleus TaxID=5963 RepID=A0A1R2BMD3_9CILI|nr:hypothetical protein SteCoe_22406 [Stentor coeruleus]
MERSTFKLPVSFRINSFKKSSDCFEIQMLGKGFESLTIRQNKSRIICTLKTFSAKLIEIPYIFGPGFKGFKSMFEAYLDSTSKKLILIGYGLSGGGSCLSVAPIISANPIKFPVVFCKDRMFNKSEKVSMLNYSVNTNDFNGCYIAMKRIEDSEFEPGSEYDILKKLIHILWKFVEKNTCAHEKLQIRIINEAEKCALIIIKNGLQFIDSEIKTYLLNPLANIKAKIKFFMEERKDQNKIIASNPASNALNNQASLNQNSWIKLMENKKIINVVLCDFQFNILKFEIILSFMITDVNYQKEIMLASCKILVSIVQMIKPPILIDIGSQTLKADVINLISVLKPFINNKKLNKNFVTILQIIKENDNPDLEIPYLCDYIKKHIGSVRWVIIYYALEELFLSINKDKIKANDQFKLIEETLLKVSETSSLRKNSRKKIKFKAYKMCYEIEKFGGEIGDKAKNLSELIRPNIIKSSILKPIIECFENQSINDAIIDDEAQHTFEIKKLELEENYNQLKKNCDASSDAKILLSNFISDYKNESELIEGNIKNLEKCITNCTIEMSNHLDKISKKFEILGSAMEKAKKDVYRLKMKSEEGNIRTEESMMNEFFDYDCYVDCLGVVNHNFMCNPNSSPDSQIPIIAKAIEFINDPKHNVLLLTGYAGCGKTLTLYKIYENLVSRELIVPIKIHLGLMRDVDKGLIEDYFIKLGHSLETINIFRGKSEDEDISLHRKFILLLDAYDEISISNIKDCCIRRVAGLENWQDIKIIITCRLIPIIKSDANYWKFFTSKKEDLIEIRLSAFNPAQRTELFENLNNKNPLTNGWTVEKLENTIMYNDSLSSIQQIPFNLKLIYNIIPKIYDSSRNNFSTLKLLEEYVKLYIERGIEKIRYQGRKFRDIENRVINYCKELAKLMRARNLEYLVILKKNSKDSNEQKLLDRENQEVEDMFSCSPLIIYEECTVEFISTDILDYFNYLNELDIVNSTSEMQKEKIESTENIIPGIVSDIEVYEINKYLIDELRANPELQKKSLSNLNEAMPNSIISKSVKLALALSYAQTDVRDQEEINIRSGSGSGSGNETAICTINMQNACAKKDGSIIIGETKIWQLKNDIIRSLIPSSKGNFILGFSDRKYLYLYCLHNKAHIKEKIISENVQFLTSVVFSDNEAKLIVALQNIHGDVLRIYNLIDLDSRPIEIIEDKYEIQSIYLTPEEGEYMIVIKENLNFDYYHDNILIWSKVFNSSTIDFRSRIIGKVRAFLKSNTSATTVQQIYQKLDVIQAEGFVEDLNTDDSTRYPYVNIQLCVEQLFKYYIQRKEIKSCVCFIHADAPATPLCADPYKLNVENNSLINAVKREKVKQVLIVESRAAIIRSLLECTQTVQFYCVYLNRNYTTRNIEQREIYQENLNKFNNLHDCGLNCENDNLLDCMSGATYLLEHKDGSLYMFSLQGKQAVAANSNFAWKIWFENVKSRTISERLENLSKNFKKFGFLEFSKIHESLKEKEL